MFDSKGRFIVENYNKQTTFSSFLPGISGIDGIPIWCFYVNRGQAIASFGSQDKNHSIMEFYPAHQAYQLTKTMGFRTFLKINGTYYEPFQQDDVSTRMYIGMNELEIEEVNHEYGIQTNVVYYTLPDEKVGGLVRSVTLQNIGDKEIEVQVVDGIPALIPYGIDLPSLKEMAQTMKAWMQVEDTETKLPYYRVRYSTKDSTVVSRIEEGNYFFALSEEGEHIPILVDPDILFEHDTAFQQPVGFVKASVKGLQEKSQITQNNVPCGFLFYEKTIMPNSKSTTHTVTGQAGSKELLQELARRCHCSGYFEEKYRRAVELTSSLSDCIEGKTESPVFDAYSRQTFIDNVLRGGYPVQIGEQHIFYVYARKHGDMERDYNFFRMLPEYYSQGNGNYRDINQNRRSDVMFHPFIKDYNIKMFYNLIQLDGYNPLSVQQVSYQLTEIQPVLSYIDKKEQNIVEEFFQQEFSPGGLFTFLAKRGIKASISKTQLLELVINHSILQQNAEFGEGYWVDHWTYNLDLVEAYLSVYPEDERRLLFEDCTYTYYESKALVLPRAKRYVETANGIRQYHCVDEQVKKNINHNQVKTIYGKGHIYHSNLITKLIVIIANKFATIDMYGMGIEMEAGKPGWYDAVNGLPGIFGSSMSETYELLRLVRFTIEKLMQYHLNVSVPTELNEFIMSLDWILQCYNQEKMDYMYVWNKMNHEKEKYRERISFGVEGIEETIDNSRIIGILSAFRAYMETGIKRACLESEVCPTYFAYEVSEYEVINDTIIPKKFEQMKLPLFLEGAVHYYKIASSIEEKRALYEKVKASELFDKKLLMYKVNASLEEASYEIGRAKAFSPGWLENESIWLHMEYKYLLELLKSRMFEQFFDDFQNACIPFLDYKMYGRSTIENSSFLVSSVNVNNHIHGKGFVARLSGATAEFLQMWQIMMFGINPIRMDGGELLCLFEPALPQYLIKDECFIEATFLGACKIVYLFNKRVDIIPGRYHIHKMLVMYKNGKEESYKKQLNGDVVEQIRKKMVTSITCEVFVV